MFYSSVSECEFDAIALTETWLHDDVHSSEIFPTEYHVYRKDRNFLATHQTRGGGVLLALKDHIKAEVINLPYFDVNFPTIDLLACKCFLSYKTFYIIVLYIPPATTFEDFELVFESLEQLEFLQTENVIVMGDFNVPSFVNSDIVDSKTIVIKNFMYFLNLNQVNQMLNSSDRLLDLVLCNVDCEIISDNAPLVPVDAHHPALIISFHKIDCKNSQFITNRNKKTYNFKNADFPALYNSLLQIDWTFLTEFEDVNSAVDEFYERLYLMFDSHVPLYKSHKRQFPNWYTSAIIKNIKRKARLLKKYRISHNENYLLEFRRLRREIKEQIKIAYDIYIENVQSSINANAQNFWSFIKSKNNTSRIPGTMFCENESYTDPQDIVNIFGNFFKSVFLPSELEESEALDVMSNFDSLNNIISESVTEREIKEASKKLKNKMTSGPDGIPSFIVKDCISVFVTPMYIIFNLALKTSVFPNRWKEAKVVPIFKNGDKSHIINYRSISILSNFSKLFEVVLYNRIYPSVHNLISQSQHGFMCHRSTVTNLAVISQYVSNIVDNRGQVDVIYTDFSKAFDRIDHNVLLKKLELYGCNNQMKEFFKSYLQERPQYVSYNGYNSFKYEATSGVPQGSNLGPLLFILFINDLSSIIQCHQLFFADDLKVFTEIHTLNDCQKLQDDLDRIQTWCINNKLHLNPVKCKFISFARKHTVYEYPYHINMNMLSRCTSFKDLGVTFDSQFTFTNHLNHKITEATKFFGFIVRNCRNFTEVSALKILYYSYIRSKLEYGSLIWYPFYNCHIEAVERVQRRFLKYLVFKQDGEYPARGINYSYLVERFNFTSLDIRRKCASLSFLYKLLHHQIDCPDLLAQMNFYIPRLQSRQNIVFYSSRARTNILLRSPIYVMSENFNNISDLCDINTCTLTELINKAKEFFTE